MDEDRRSESHRNPVDRGDDRLVETVQRGEQAHLRTLSGSGGILHEVLEIVAGGKRGAGPPDQHDTPCTWIGLLIVEVTLPPAPSIGTTISFGPSCGSLITSSGPRTGPNVTWTPPKTSDQCAIGCAPKTSSRMAVSWGMFAISFAGSENRESVRRSGRPMAFATAASLSGVTRRTNQVPSAA